MGSIAACAAVALCPDVLAGTSMPTLNFNGQDYVLREAKDGTVFNFTPRDQPDVQKRTDLFSVVTYRDVQNYEQLVAQKNRVVATYDHPGAKVFTAKDAEPSADFRGESYLVAGQCADGYCDANVARFVLSGGMGFALIYTRSFYDTRSDDAAHDAPHALGEWINSQGTQVTTSLLDLTIVLNEGVLTTWKNAAAA